jgi:uncharacterized protein YecA (UPF0149 family)
MDPNQLHAHNKIRYTINRQAESGETMSINRNDTCFCGSGKKYKNCCMKNDVVSLDSIREGELNKLQFELLEFAINEHDELLSDLVDDLMGDEYLEDEEEEILVFYLTLWAIFSIRYDEKQTIIEQFIEQKKKGNKLRASALNQLEAWVNTAPSYSIVTKIIDDFHLEIEDVFTSEKKHVKLLEKEEAVVEGGSILGYLLPYGNHYSYFTTFLEFNAIETPGLASEIIEHFEESDLENEKDFMRSAFPSLIIAILVGELGEGPDIEKLEWENPKYKEVAALYIKHIEEEGLPKHFQDLGVTFWYMFCTKEKPVIRKPEIYSAALHYFLDKKIPLELYTQAEIAEIHSVSTASLSKAYRHLEKGLEDELESLNEFMEQDELLFPDYDVDFLDDLFDEEDVDDEDEIDLDDLFLEDDESPFSKKKK